MAGQPPSHLKDGSMRLIGKIWGCSYWRFGSLSRHRFFRMARQICPDCHPREAIEISAYSTGAARLLAALLAILAISGFFRLMRIEKWLTFITGLLIALSPWVFGVAGEEHALAISNEVVVGYLTCVVSLTKTTRLAGDDARLIKTGATRVGSKEFLQTNASTRAAETPARPVNSTRVRTSSLYRNAEAPWALTDEPFVNNEVARRSEFDATCGEKPTPRGSGRHDAWRAFFPDCTAEWGRGAARDGSWRRIVGYGCEAVPLT